MLLHTLWWRSLNQPSSQRIRSTQGGAGCCYPLCGRGCGLSALARGSAAPKGRGRGAATHPLMGAVDSAPWSEGMQHPRGKPGFCYSPSGRGHGHSPPARLFIAAMGGQGASTRTLGCCAHGPSQRVRSSQGGPGCCYPPTTGVCGLRPLARGFAAPKCGGLGCC